MAAGGGGSWKVAFADFMTALMALFLVLWILNQNQEVKGAVEEYFKNPWKAALSDNTGIIPIKNAALEASTRSHFEDASAVPLNVVQRPSEDFLKTFVQNSEYRDNHSMAVESNPEGVLINFMDDPKQPMFKDNSTDLSDSGKLQMQLLASLLRNYPTTIIELEGHTENGMKPVREGYGPWEFSANLAEKVRQNLVLAGVKEKQFAKVAAVADTKPLGKLKSFDPKKEDTLVPADSLLNRRVSILVHVAQATE